jgi:predicted 3-demethylubiquinone-9 3-methyltransferase (glyoxalase superfamily)
VNCQTQKEVDYYWENLSRGGKKVACGWLTDKFGVSWQVTPTILMDLIKDKDPAKRERVMKAMMKMVKLDIGKIKKAAKGK